MTRPYIKLDPRLPERKDYYPDGPWRALVETFCYAASQDTPGRFKNERVLRALLGARGRHVPFLIEQGDLTPSNLGFVYVEGWEQWQEGKYPTVAARLSAIEDKRGPMSPAERAFTYRQRVKQRDASHVTPTVTRAVTGGNTSPDVTSTRPDVTTANGSKDPWNDRPLRAAS